MDFETHPCQNFDHAFDIEHDSREKGLDRESYSANVSSRTGPLFRQIALVPYRPPGPEDLLIESCSGYLVNFVLVFQPSR